MLVVVIDDNKTFFIHSNTWTFLLGFILDNGGLVD